MDQIEFCNIVLLSKCDLLEEDQIDDVHVHLFEQAGRNSTVTEVSNWVASMSEEEQQKIFEEFTDIKSERMS